MKNPVYDAFFAWLKKAILAVLLEFSIVSLAAFVK